MVNSTDNAEADADDTKKSKRIDFRIDPTQKELLETAAELEGQSLSAFMVSNSVRVAQQVIEARAATRLSLADWNRFHEILSNPHEPKASLKDAVKSYVEHIKSSHGF